MEILVFIRMAGESTLFTHKAGESVDMYLVAWQVGVLVLNRMADGSTCIYSHDMWEYLYVLIT